MGHKRPATSISQPLWHKKCGGRIEADPFFGKMVCPQCNQGWRMEWLLGLSPEAISDRFYTESADSEEVMVLVEKDDGAGSRYLSLVPPSEAHKYHPANIDLGNWKPDK